MMATLRIFGVRHHSPACARRVQEIIREVRPAYVLIEGPVDMNDRLGELRLPHALPIAVYSYRLDEQERDTRSRGTWTPFCAYSPEWVALQEAAAVGSEARFIDLPAWHDAFREIENRYGEGRRRSDRIQALIEEHGFDGSDALWDHLFEAALDADGRAGEALEARLAEYFDALRGEDAAAPMDRPREAYMAEWIAWAMGRAVGTVLVVCGGYHAPALRALAAGIEPRDTPPACPMPERAEVGSFLVPFTFRRLDSFAGYASGMPSPAYYQALWDRGDDAPDAMLRAAVERLRAIGQVVSTADYAAARTSTEALARLRGHRRPTRVDTLDGLTSTLLKEPIDGPLPWSERRTLAPGTAPLLVELVATYSGDRRGALAEGTPSPPIVADARDRLDALGLALGPAPRRVELSITERETRPARALLHRLRVLGVPGVELQAEGSFRRGEPRKERWALAERDETLPTLIERAVYGASVEQAARTRLMEQLGGSSDLLQLVSIMRDAGLAGFEALADTLSASALHAVEREGHLGRAGQALDALLAMQRRARLGEHFRGGTGGEHAESALLSAVFERALWLLEGAAAVLGHPFDVDDLYAVRAIARAVPELSTTDAAVSVFTRVAERAAASPSLRGACLGALWALGRGDEDARLELALRTTRGVPSDVLGELLSGLAVLAREELQSSALLDAVDARVTALDDDAFMIALPPLRRAFAFFPPRERLRIAKRILARAGVRADAGAMLEPVAIDADAVRVETELFAQLERYGLTGPAT